jgi:probable F420-dependent oxidoreductase
MLLARARVRSTMTESPQPPRPQLTATLGRFGIWTHWSNLNADFAREIEWMGYGAIWIGGSPAGDLAVVDELLGATDRLAVATGIVNIWKDDARTVAASHRRITAEFPDRFLLGVGVGHPEATSDYTRPYRALVDYLDVLDGEGVPAGERVLAALGPKVLRLARDRSAGAHPYLTTARHTREARELLGPDVLLAPEQKVVIDPDVAGARAAGRKVVKYYLGLRNYVDNLRRLGFTDDDLAGEGSDRLIDALVGHGDAVTAAGHVTAHLEAGADHVPVQLVASQPADLLAGYAELAATLEP